MRLEIYLAKKENEFLPESVTFADDDHQWERRYNEAMAASAAIALVMPDELGPPPEGVSVHDRCNRWMLYSALSHGLNRVSFLTLWDGKPGDGPGGAEHMSKLVQKLTGRQPINIDPATL